MKNINLPGIGTTVPLALGTDYYGKRIPEEDAVLLMEYFTGAGLNIIDTAHVYSDYLPGEKHMSEKVIGKWLKKSGKRDSVILSTKGGFPELDDYHKSRISFREISNDLEESLECLGTDRIDIYWLHRDNTEADAGEIFEWMETFRKSGKIIRWGVSNWKSERIDILLRKAAGTGDMLAGPVASQIKWSLAKTVPGSVDDDTLVEMDDAEMAWYREHSLPVFAYSSQAKGFFSKIKEDAQGNIILPEGKAGIRYGSAENIETYRKLKEIAVRKGYGITETALAYFMKNENPEVIPIIGPRNTDQLRESLKSLEIYNV